MVERAEVNEEYPLPGLDELGEAEADLHGSEHIFNPHLDEFRSLQHAREILDFLQHSELEPDISRKVQAFPVLDHALYEDGDPTYFDKLYGWEASARKVTNWTLEQIVDIQSRLYSNGFLDDKNLVAQREELLSYIPLAYDTSGRSLQTIGKEVSALELSAMEFWPLVQMDPNLGLQYLEEVKEAFGEQWYRVKVLERLSTYREYTQYRAATQAERSHVQERYARSYKSFVRRLPKEQQQKLLIFYQKAHLVMVQRQAADMGQSVMETIGKKLQQWRASPRITRLLRSSKNQPTES